MLALRAAWAAYTDGWARVGRAPWLLVGLSATLILAIATGAPGGPVLQVEAAPYRWAMFAKLEGLFKAASGGSLYAAADSSFSPSMARQLTLWLAAACIVLSGSAVDRYARQRPLDARTFWGVSGELGFRLVRLAGAAALLVTVPLWILSLAFSAIPYPGARLNGWLLLLLLILSVGVLLAGTAIHDCARVRMVVERRRSALFAIAAGLRFVWRHLGPVAALEVLHIATLWAIWEVAALIGGKGLLPASLSGVALLTGALVGLSAMTSLFQASLAHAGYVAPPRLVWPDSPAIETLGERRDFPPAV
jgi:hypothetical protein